MLGIFEKPKKKQLFYFFYLLLVNVGEELKRELEIFFEGRLFSKYFVFVLN